MPHHGHRFAGRSGNDGPAEFTRTGVNSVTESVTGGTRVDGFWCETVVRCPDAGGEWYLGGQWAATPAEALRWLRSQALRLADALDPRPGAGPLPAGALAAVASSPWSPGRVFRDWADDTAFLRVQQAALAAGRPVSANARGPDRIRGVGAVDVLYSLSARPVLRGAPARRLLRVT
ncbi:hypothetical protein [Streptomyces bohaiensis]|uniref:hypothetical protein n=1 Tax=Streptomyces bohaiensis TaxID=1431344 RepID=UPI003B7888F3